MSRVVLCLSQFSATKPAAYATNGRSAVCRTKTYTHETGYPSYRFKTYARDAVEAVVKIKCFLHSPRAECTLLLPKDHVRETESCRMQVRER